MRRRDRSAHVRDGVAARHAIIRAHSGLQWSPRVSAPERIPKTPKATFAWDDPLLLGEQLAEDERMVRDSARSFAQEQLLPRVVDAFRHERVDTGIFREMGQMGLLGSTF